MVRGAVVSLMTVFVCVCVRVDAGAYSGGSGSADAPYLIATAEDIIEMSNNPMDWASNFLMTADVNMAEYVFGQAVIAPDEDNVQPRFQGTVFSGVFNGGGHVIRNLTIDGNGTGTAYIGLLGIVSGSVSNAGLETLSVTGGKYTGGLCGYNKRGTIINCYTTGSVSVGDRNYDGAGGLCGMNGGSISKCYTAGSVTGGDLSGCLGGLCGLNEGTISDCYATGSVTGGEGSSDLGGLCGCNGFDGTISKCFATGSVIGGGNSSRLGGLCGSHWYSTVGNCYATGSVTEGEGSSDLGGLCGWNGFDGTISKCYATGLVTGGEYIGGLCWHNAGAINNCYFYLFAGPDSHLGSALDEIELGSPMSFSGFDFAGNDDDGTEDVWATVTGHCPKLAWQSGDGPEIPDYRPLTALMGSGRGEDPFQINSRDDFGEFISNSALNCGYYILSTDIDLSDQTFAAAAVDRLFGGDFDGRGHMISNLTVDTNGTVTDHLGLFRMVCGFVRNIVLKGVSVTGGASSCYVGGLCGMNLRGTIMNCYVTGSVTGGDNLGGLCGYSEIGTISNCYAEGSVAGKDLLAGLCGMNCLGTINSSYATGSVTGRDHLGGLCGHNDMGTISDCYAAGSVTGRNCLGGLCGGDSEGGTIRKCYSTGSVTGGDNSYHLGGLCGDYDYWTQIDESFWDVESSGVGNSGDTNRGAIGKTTAEMMTLSTFADPGWDFDDGDGDAADWMMLREGEDYPRLAWQEVYAGDIAGLYGVRWDDFCEVARHWGDEGCPAGCEDADIDGNGTVGLGDLVLIAEGWGRYR